MPTLIVRDPGERPQTVMAFDKFLRKVLAVVPDLQDLEWFVQEAAFGLSKRIVDLEAAAESAPVQVELAELLEMTESEAAYFEHVIVRSADHSHQLGRFDSGFNFFTGPQDLLKRIQAEFSMSEAVDWVPPTGKV